MPELCTGLSAVADLSHVAVVFISALNCAVIDMIQGLPQAAVAVAGILTTYRILQYLARFAADSKVADLLGMLESSMKAQRILHRPSVKANHQHSQFWTFVVLQDSHIDTT